ncbi:MAG: nucleotidyltransferase [Anaerovoracaceae bacterium]
MENKKVLGIVAEYNPFHTGHKYHILESKEKTGAEYVVAVMSGNFTQRGEPSLLNKWKRSELAIKAGVDLVIELPFVFACNSAEYFAKGSVGVLNGLGIIDYLSFGSESGSLEDLSKTADLLLKESDEFKEKLQLFLKKGDSFPKARAKALGHYGKFLNDPNNLLAIEYLKELKALNSNIKPMTILRKGSDYNSDKLGALFSSANGIRKSIENKDKTAAGRFLPEEIREDILNEERFSFVNDQKYFQCLKFIFLRDNKFGEIFSCSEGLENIVSREIRNVGNIEELIDKLKSKRYTRTRIMRFLAHSLVGLYKGASLDLFGHVLAFNDRGAKILREIKVRECNDIPIIQKVNKANVELMGLDIVASDLYNHIYGLDTYLYSDFVKKPFIDKSY